MSEEAGPPRDFPPVGDALPRVGGSGPRTRGEVSIMQAVKNVFSVLALFYN